MNFKIACEKGMYILIGVIAALEILGTLAMLKWGKGDEFKGSYLDYANSEIGLIVLFTTILGLHLLPVLLLMSSKRYN